MGKRARHIVLTNVVIANYTKSSPKRKAVRSSSKKKGVELLHSPNFRIWWVITIHLIPNAVEDRPPDPWLKNNHFRFQIGA